MCGMLETVQMVCRGELKHNATLQVISLSFVDPYVDFCSHMHIQVKPLGVIWGKYGDFYNRKNTIMFDDIGRNFLMNPQNGLKVHGHPPLFLS